MNQSH